MVAVSIAEGKRRDPTPSAARYDGGMPTSYPIPPTSDQVDDYHGTLIADPYRPLEDADAPATRAWIDAENVLTESVLGAVPGREAIRARLAQLWDVPRRGVPWRRGERWFQLRNTGLQNQDVLWTADGPRAEGRVLLDPNALNAAGTTTLNAISVSESGRLVAIATSEAGSDWQTWRVIRARRRHRAARPRPVEQVRRRGVDARRGRVHLRPLPRARGR